MRLIEPLDSQQVHDPEVPLYRLRTVAMLRKYLRMSIELGHLPVLMGVEFFRSHVTGYATNSFEDTAIFVHDVEQCLRALSPRNQNVITKLFFQQYTNEEAARLMNCGHTTIVRWRSDAVDALTAIFLHRKLLKRMPQLPVEPLDTEPDEPQSSGHGPLPPKKNPRAVRTIHAVALFA